MQKSSQMWESVFVIGTEGTITASILIDEMQPLFSESQLKKDKESDTYTFFCDLIHSLESKRKCSCCIFM